MFKRLLLLIVPFFLFSTTAESTTLPSASVGDAYVGLLSINPATPLSSFSTSTDFIYTSSVGTLSVLINGGTFSSAIDFIDVRPGSDNTWRWGLGTGGLPSTFNGGSIPLSVMSMYFYGSTSSTSILPLALSSYSTNDPTNFFTGPNFQMIADAPDGISGATYAGPITSLVALDDKGDFAFAGTLEETTQFLISVPVPEPSTWAMMLLGFAGLGFMAYRRKQNEQAPIARARTSV
jgi:hypothetical protein